MNEMAYVLQAWLPLIVWQQVDAPRYRTGFITVACLSFVLIVTAFVLRSAHHRQIRRLVRSSERWQMELTFYSKAVGFEPGTC